MSGNYLVFIFCTTVAMYHSCTALVMPNLSLCTCARGTESTVWYCSLSYLSVSLVVFILSSYTLSFSAVSFYVLRHLIVGIVSSMKLRKEFYVFFFPVELLTVQWWRGIFCVLIFSIILAHIKTVGTCKVFAVGHNNGKYKGMHVAISPGVVLLLLVN